MLKTKYKKGLILKGKSFCYGIINSKKEGMNIEEISDIHRVADAA